MPGWKEDWTKYDNWNHMADVISGIIWIAAHYGRFKDGENPPQFIPGVDIQKAEMFRSMQETAYNIIPCFWKRYEENGQYEQLVSESVLNELFGGGGKGFPRSNPDFPDAHYGYVEPGDYIGLDTILDIVAVYQYLNGKFTISTNKAVGTLHKNDGATAFRNWWERCNRNKTEMDNMYCLVFDSMMGNYASEITLNHHTEIIVDKFGYGYSLLKTAEYSPCGTYELKYGTIVVSSWCYCLDNPGMQHVGTVGDYQGVFHINWENLNGVSTHSVLPGVINGDGAKKIPLDSIIPYTFPLPTPPCNGCDSPYQLTEFMRIEKAAIQWSSAELNDL